MPFLPWVKYLISCSDISYICHFNIVLSLCESIFFLGECIARDLFRFCFPLEVFETILIFLSFHVNAERSAGLKQIAHFPFIDFD